MQGVIFSSPPSIQDLLNTFFNSSDLITKEIKSNYPLVENSAMKKLVPDVAWLTLLLVTFELII